MNILGIKQLFYEIQKLLTCTSDDTFGEVIVFTEVTFKAIQIIGQRKWFYWQKIPEPSCARKETVDIDILKKSMSGDRKIMQPIRIMSRPPSRIRKWDHLSQFRWTSTKVTPIEKTYTVTFWQWAMDSREAARERPTVLHICFCSLSNNSK